MISLICGTQEKRTIEIDSEDRLVVAKGKGAGNGEIGKGVNIRTFAVMI